MTLGIALLLIFILYLTDKHNQWRKAARFGLALVPLVVLVAVGIYLWSKHEGKLEQQETEEINKKAEEEYNKIKSHQEQPRPTAGNEALPANRQVVLGPDGKYYSFPNGTSQTRIHRYFAKKYPHVKVLHDSDLSTEEFGSLTCGHIKRGEVATLLEDDGTWVKVKTSTGAVGWSRATTFEVISEKPAS